MIALEKDINNLEGPILVIGASGFVGAYLFRACLENRKDVHGTFFTSSSWRLQGIPATNSHYLNLEDSANIRDLLDKVQPKTIFDCSSYGAYSFEQNFERIHETNYLRLIHLLEILGEYKISAYIHSGSSSEYGVNSSAPAEDDQGIPNSHYALSKLAASNAITYYGKEKSVPVANLRLYSVYGPYEDRSRLIPVLCEKLSQGTLPTLAGPGVSRDFVYVDDVCHAYVKAAVNMDETIAGESFNIGTGVKTTLEDVAVLSKEAFSIEQEVEFNKSKGHSWDTKDWYANPEKAEKLLGWKAQTSFVEGLKLTKTWWEDNYQEDKMGKGTKKVQTRQSKTSITAIIACYKDGQAIPIMHENLVKVFNKLELSYEIIFINDGSPDDSEQVIQEISAKDPYVIGITHARNFGSQAAFKSGLELATNEASVLLDGDLQDPPEIIEQFVEKWREGADVVYGCRVKREMPIWLEFFYRAFYFFFAGMSSIKIPKNAGDFSLIDQKVVHWLIQFPERDLFLRGLRAYVGFKQVGVDYVRPERMFGVSTNNWIKNFGWAKKGIFSFSLLPLHLLTAFGSVTLLGSIFIRIGSVAIKFMTPELAPKGITFLALLIMFFGSSIILCIGILGEYIGKIQEEVKARPTFIRKHIIQRGKIDSFNNKS